RRRLAPREVLNALQKLAEVALADGIGSDVDLIRGSADIFAGLRDLVIKLASRSANRRGDASHEVGARVLLILGGGPQFVARAGNSVFRVFAQVRRLLLDLPGNVLSDP